LVRSFEWRYANPFRVTPGDKPGDGHWEGSGFRWEKSGSGYIQIAGDVWYELVDTVDEGYDDPDTFDFIPGHEVSSATFAEYDEGDDFTVNGNVYEIGGKSYYDASAKVRIYYFFLIRTVPGAHHTVLIDYWNTWIYRNLQWTQTGSGIRRNHV